MKKTVTISIYSPWVVEFLYQDNPNNLVEIRRYRPDRGRPNAPSDIIPERALVAFALTVLGPLLGTITTDEVLRRLRIEVPLISTDAK